MVWASRPAWCLVALLAVAMVPAQALMFAIHPRTPHGPCNGHILCKQPMPLEGGKATAKAESAAEVSQGEKLVGGAEGSNADVGGQGGNAAAKAESVAKDVQGGAKKAGGSDAKDGKAATKTEASAGDAEAGAAGGAGGAVGAVGAVGAGGAKNGKAAAVSEGGAQGGKAADGTPGRSPGNAFGVGSAGSAQNTHASVATATAPTSAYMASPAAAPAPAEPPCRPRALGDYSPAFKAAIEKTLKSGKALRSAVQDLKEAAHMLKEKVAIPRIIEKALQ